MIDKNTLKRAIKTILDFYVEYTMKVKDFPKFRDLAIILFYELDLDNLEQAYEILEYLNYIGFLIYDREEKYKINLNEFF